MNANGSHATGIYDLRFAVYDAVTNGNEVSGVLTNAATPVTNGLFSVALDFGAGMFTGAGRWLDIAVRTNGAGTFTELTPRQQLTPTPYAIYAENANAAGLSGTVPLAQLPASVVTNGEASVTLGGLTVNGTVTAGTVTASSLNVGSGTTLSANYASIAGGYLNTIQAQADYSAIGGGQGNLIQTNAPNSFLGGGNYNSIQTSAGNSFLGGGYNNSIQPNAIYSVLGGGYFNSILTSAGNSFLGGGLYNTNGGAYSVVPGGYGNYAGGQYSFAAGRDAQALHQGAFVWADSQNAAFASTANDQVSFRCQGGVRFTSGGSGSDLTVSWTPGSPSWSFSSDRNLKESFAPVDTRSLLDKLGRLPITEWNYIGYAQRHIGPMAQDWHALFPLNDSDTTLNSADVAGVSLAAIQGLNQKLNQMLNEKDAEIQDLKVRLEKLERLVNAQNGGGL